MSKEFLCFQKMFFEQDKAPSSPRDDQFMTAMREVDHWHSWRVRGREQPVRLPYAMRTYSFRLISDIQPPRPFSE